ncbi:uroporphyrinogen decarboxylase family protein [Shigella flexneri]
MSWMPYAPSAAALNGDVPLIGFSGSPWTLATYMVEGGSSKAFTKIKKMMYAEPQTLHLLLDKLADSVILYLNARLKPVPIGDDF